MADEKHQPSHDSSTESDMHRPKNTPTAAGANPGSDNEVYVDRRRSRMGRRGLIAILIIAILILLALAVGAGYMMNNHFERRLISQPNYTVNRMMRYDDNSGVGYGQYVETTASSGSITTTVYNYKTGVVTAVNSDNIVIAGNGKQTTIKTDSSTQYVGGTKPVVNDTVSVIGTTTDNTITATRISVVNQ